MPSVATRRSDTRAPSSSKRNRPGRWPIKRPHTCPPRRVHSNPPAQGVKIARRITLSASGVADETQIHTHMCYSEFNDIIDAIGALDADVISIETARSKMELLAFTTY